MASIKLDGIVWYADHSAQRKGEPGIYHSYMASLATAINHIAGNLDPVWLMGSSSFAFRIMAAGNLCPSAMSIFNWSAILPEAVENSGYKCTYISRLWKEEGKEAERREQAHEAIVNALQKGRPAIVWDIDVAEWGVIIGYDAESRIYHALSNKGKAVVLPTDKLGRNGINILSVAIPTELNGRTRDEMILNSLRAAVNHAEEKEWIDRPNYRDGLGAFDHWSSAYENAAMIVEAGRGENIHKNAVWQAVYYAAHYFSARCYARDYLRVISDGKPKLAQAAERYERVASLLKSVWKSAINMKKIENAELLRAMSQSIKEAGIAERGGVEMIKEYLAGI
jgi:hypothetical protein